jgi:hypothetical protein
MKYKQFIIYYSKILYIDRYIYESDEMFYFRINYIYNKINEINSNEINSNKLNINDIIGLSMIEMNKKFLNCNYLPEFNLSLA